MSALRAVPAPQGDQPTLADRIARREQFARAARRRELDVVEALLIRDPPASVAFVHGPGGVGKTAFLELAAGSGRSAGWHPVWIEGRAVAVDSAALEERLSIARLVQRPLVVIDDYDAIAEQGERLREELLPALPELAIVLIAGRRAPELGWMEGVWRAMTVQFALAPLDGCLPPPVAPPAKPFDSAAVRAALRNLGVPVELATSPLATGATMAERAESVRALVRGAVHQAFGDTHDQRLLRRVLERGYLDPAPSHELAADELHLSRSTYFRRLRQASDQLACWLVHEAASSPTQACSAANAAAGRLVRTT